MSYLFALAGCGRIAQRHAQQIAAHGRLLAVCDIDAGRAHQMARRYQCALYDSLDNLLVHERPDVVCICTPNGLHAPQAIRALEAGCHVLCEKPMAISAESGRLMVAAAQKTGKKLFVVKQNRYNPPVTLVKELLTANKLGKIFNFQVNCFWNRPAAYYASSWRGTPDMDGGTLYTQFSHFIDLLYWLLGDVEQVQGLRANYAHQGTIAFEDTGVVLLKMQNGSMGTLHYSVNSHQKNMEGSFTIFGEKGTVKIGGQYLNELDFFSVEGEAVPVLDAGKGANDYGFYTGSMSNHDIVYDNLVKALDNPAHPFLEAAEALKTVEIIEMIYKASPVI